MDNSQKSDRRYGLEDIRGFDSLPDKEPKSVKNTFLTMGVLLDITSLQVSLVHWVTGSTEKNKRKVNKIRFPKYCLEMGCVNSLWHLDGHHSLIRWKILIHGCIDGFSRIS